jgi:hypothetical protein
MQTGASGFVGLDVDHRKVFVGDIVDHTEKDLLVGGRVLEGGQVYQGEPAVRVDYSVTSPDQPSNWLNRLSRLRVRGPQPDATGNPGGAQERVEVRVPRTGMHLDTAPDGTTMITVAKGTAVTVTLNEDGEPIIFIG